MNNEPLRSTTILDSLRADATTKQRKGTLDRLVHACDALCARGRSFTLRELEKHCLTVFGKGPNAQTVSNDNGLRTYVEARRTEVGVKKTPRQRSELAYDIENISDPTVRSRMRLLAEDYRLVKKRLRLLTESLSKLSPPLNLDEIFSDKSNTTLVKKSNDSSLASQSEIHALETVIAVLLDDVRVRRAGLDMDESDIVTKGLRETFIAGKDISLLSGFLAKLIKDEAR